MRPDWQPLFENVPVFPKAGKPAKVLILGGAAHSVPSLSLVSQGRLFHRCDTLFCSRAALAAEVNP